MSAAHSSGAECLLSAAKAPGQPLSTFFILGPHAFQELLSSCRVKQGKPWAACNTKQMDLYLQMCHPPGGPGGWGEAILLRMASPDKSLARGRKGSFLTSETAASNQCQPY